MNCYSSNNSLQFIVLSSVDSINSYQFNALSSVDSINGKLGGALFGTSVFHGPSRPYKKRQNRGEIISLGTFLVAHQEAHECLPVCIIAHHWAQVNHQLKSQIDDEV